MVKASQDYDLSRPVMTVHQYTKPHRHIRRWHPDLQSCATNPWNHCGPGTPSPSAPIWIASNRRLSPPGKLKKEDILSQHADNFDGLGLLWTTSLCSSGRDCTNRQNASPQNTTNTRKGERNPRQIRRRRGYRKSERTNQLVLKRAHLKNPNEIQSVHPP